jgi:hypothetical protein
LCHPERSEGSRAPARLSSAPTRLRETTSTTSAPDFRTFRRAPAVALYRR